MLIVQVYVKVFEKDVDHFIQATIENASNSIQEHGVFRFDFMQNNDALDEFLLTEVYADEQAALDHKKTPHYLKWRETVAKMMAKPRSSTKYHEIHPKSVESWIAN